MAQAFRGTADDVAVWQRILESDPENHSDNMLALTRDGSLISSCHIAPRTMHYGEALVRVAGIASVFTVVSEQRRGYATALLGEAVARLRQRSFHLAILSTTIPGFYHRLGWQTIPKTARIWRLRRNARGRHPAARQFDGINDLAAVMSIHSAWAPRAVGMLVRSEEFWRRNIWYQEDRAGFLVGDVRGSAAAYARTRLRPGTREPPGLATLQEVAWDADPQPLGEVIAAALTAAWRAGASLVCESIPPQSLPPHLFEGYAEKDSEKVLTDFMGLVLDWQGLAEALQPALEVRLAAAETPVSEQDIVIIVDGQQARLRVCPPRVEVGAGSPLPFRQEHTTTIRLDSAGAVRLLFEGWDAPALAVPSVPPEAASLMRVMFPRVSFYHWTQGHY
jgi:GNAT superfamily N-acetyltransferase